MNGFRVSTLEVSIRIIHLEDTKGKILLHDKLIVMPRELPGELFYKFRILIVLLHHD